jgi:hypothetical protein
MADLYTIWADKEGDISDLDWVTGMKSFFDHLISDLIEERQKQDIIRYVLHISEKGDFISLDDAKIAWDIDEG